MKSDCEVLELGSNKRKRDYKHETVCTMARLAHWKIEKLKPNIWVKSSIFKMGSWNWRLHVKKFQRSSLLLSLSKEEDPSTDSLPIVSYVLRVLNGVRRQLSASAEITYHNPLSQKYTWLVHTRIERNFFIEVEFLDMKIDIGKGSAILFFCGQDTLEGTLKSHAQLGQVNGLNRMHEDDLHRDVTIETTTGVTKTHLAVLTSRSPVFQAMFEHDLKERKTCTITIEDMTLEELKALLSYMYGTIKHDMFQKHRFALLQASHKYDIHDLKEVCEESFMLDISRENVVERLQDAWVYQLSRLKSECFRYLFEFRKVYDVQMELYHVLDKDLILEMFQEGWNTLR